MSDSATLLVHVVGARPNFMKAAPVMAALEKYPGFRQVLLHTGQHYDENMSEVFFRDLGLPRPDVNLQVGSGSQAAQTAEIMLRIEPVLLERKPAMVLVYGDVNSTVAAALAAAKLGIGVAHVEAGLRSFDRSMPEEINRVVTDHVSDLLFTPSDDADANLVREGIGRERIFRVGNVMIDTLVRLQGEVDARWPRLAQRLPVPEAVLRDEGFALVTLHRPSNVDDSMRLAEVIRALAGISEDVPVIFPVHPRTRERLAAAAVRERADRLYLVDPLGYLEFQALQKHAVVVITDSGGIQEETTFLGVPCLTLRPNTERPVTISSGTNRLVGADVEGLGQHVRRIVAGERPPGKRPELWDGQAAGRIARVLASRFGLQPAKVGLPPVAMSPCLVEAARDELQ